jgi:histone H3/H4
MNDEAKTMIPMGSLVRLIKPTLVSKECRASPEFTKALNKYLVKLAVDYTTHACEDTLSRGRKTLDLQSLKTVGEKNGFLIE